MKEEKKKRKKLPKPEKIRYCPFCGESVYSEYSDGTYQCESCGRRFGVIAVE